MIIVIDNTRNQKVKMFYPKLINFLEKSNATHSVINGDIHGLSELKKLIHKKGKSVKGIILSGSPIMLNETSNIDDYICNLYCLKHLTHIPILGICFGCQLINMYFGGTLYDMLNVHCIKMDVEGVEKKWHILNGKAQFCCRYLPKYVPVKELETLMYTTYNNNKLPCVIQHKKYNILGVMFHPEALKETQIILYEFLHNCKS